MEPSLETLRKRPFNHSRYKEFFPVKIVSLGEGGTPLIESRLFKNLFFKFEGMNPTGSFKDRGSSVEIGKALKSGKSVICASTGNMGASVAAYCGVAGLKCYIFTPRDARHTKLEQIIAYGAKLYKVRSDYAKAIDLAEKASRKYGLFLTGDYRLRREGTKSIAFEISEQMDLNLRNTNVISPIGNACLFSALWQGFCEFRSSGFIKHLPRLVGIQAKNCSPVADAFQKETYIKPVKNPKTVAGAIECGNPLDGERALLAGKESKGFMDKVTDTEILEARDLLARHEGIFSEPAGAASFAGFMKYRRKLKGRSVCIVTGHGLKTPHTAVKGREKEIRADLSVVSRIF